jgi:hypothetical protein
LTNDKYLFILFGKYIPGVDVVKSSFWVYLMNFIVILFILIMAFLLISFPFIFDKYLGYLGRYQVLATYQIPNILWLKILFYLTAIPFTVLLVMTKKLINSIFRKEPFTQRNIFALNIISICAFIDFLLYSTGTILILKNILSLVLAIATFMIGLISLVLSQLVRSAMEIKQENDLTI